MVSSKRPLPFSSGWNQLRRPTISWLPAIMLILVTNVLFYDALSGGRCALGISTSNNCACTTNSVVVAAASRARTNTPVFVTAFHDLRYNSVRHTNHKEKKRIVPFQPHQHKLQHETKQQQQQQQQQRQQRQQRRWQLFKECENHHNGAVKNHADNTIKNEICEGHNNLSQQKYTVRRDVLKQMVAIFSAVGSMATYQSFSSSSSVSWADDSPSSSVFPSTAVNIDYVTTTSSNNAAFSSISSSNTYKPAFRPNAYYVDSTQPPTLLPISRDKDQLRILYKLGQGSGTSKQLVDPINLNNILNKVVFGTINAVQGTISSVLELINNDDGTKGSDCTFVCVGVPSIPSPTDIQFAIDDVLVPMFDAAIQKKNNAVAIGLACLPYSTQSSLDQYTAGTIDSILLEKELLQSGVPESTIELYKPIWEIIQSKYNNSNNNKQVQQGQLNVNLLALAPDNYDCNVARTKGLQFVDPEKRKLYVSDPNGFINQVNDPKFRLYTDRSLLKEAGKSAPSAKDDENDTTGFFAERILIHEAAATAVSKYATTALSSTASSSSSSFVAIVAPTPDVRYLNGINGRIERICHHLATLSSTTTTATSSSTAVSSQSSIKRGLANVSADSITTILLNPTAADTLSKTRYLRLEIGTGPDTIQYQTKVADYLWFSSTPKVNVLPRLMNG